MWNKFILTLGLLAGLTFSSGCGISTAHYKFDREAAVLITPLALKEIADQKEILKAQKDAGVLSEVEFNKKIQSLDDKIDGISTWVDVTKSNLGESIDSE